MTLHLDDTKELTLKPNSFNEIAKCDKPCKNNFERRTEILKEVLLTFQVDHYLNGSL